MPRNNLSKHLKWLVTEKPFIPPAASLVAYDPDAEPTSSVTASQQHPVLSNDEASYNEPESASVSVPSPALPVAQTILPRSFAPTKTIDTHNPPEAAGTTSDMARLRATPASGKPRLVVAGLPEHVSSTPSASGTRMERNSAVEPAKIVRESNKDGPAICKQNLPQFSL